MKRLFLGISLALSLVLYGCAMQKGVIDSFVEPTYQTGSIKTLAIFPVQNASMAPAQANIINSIMVQAVQSKSTSITLISPAESARRINDAGIATQWTRFIEDFQTAGLVNKKYLSDIAKALQSDAVLQGFIGNITQKDGMQFGDGIGITRVSIHYAIIDLHNAKIIWQANSSGRVQTASFGYHMAPEVSEAMSVALKKLTDNLPAL